MRARGGQSGSHFPFEAVEDVEEVGGDLEGKSGRSYIQPLLLVRVHQAAVDVAWL